MIGCRPLTSEEVDEVSACFCGYMEHRNRLLFWLGITTGFRVSELLSLSIGDVWRREKIPENLRIRRKKSKGRKHGQSAHIAKTVHPYITRWLFVVWHRYGASPDLPLFASRSLKPRAISRMQAHRMITDTMELAGLDGAFGELATHSMRKTYAARMMEHFGDIFMVQKALRHKSPASTVAYLAFDDSELAHAIEIKWPEASRVVSKANETTKLQRFPIPAILSSSPQTNQERISK